MVLGNIIAQPQYPEEAENTGDPVKIPDIIGPWLNRKEDWVETLGKSTSFGIGAFAHFLNIVGLGGEFDFTKYTNKSSELRTRVMDTTWFNPNEAYIKRSIEDPGVRRYLESNKFRESVYMITGLMVAREASETLEAMKGRGVYSQIGADLTSVGAPVVVGPKGHLAKQTQRVITFSKADDFILAFRLTRIKVKRMGEIRVDKYTRGAMYSLGPGSGHGAVVPDSEQLVIETEDYGADPRDVRLLDLQDESCELAAFAF